MVRSHLFRNNGNGTFTDVTKKAGLGGPHEFSTSAAWVDYDRDGHLDLLVANYVQWSPETTSTARWTAKPNPTARPKPTTARPSASGTTRQRHLHRRHAKSRPLRPTSKSLGIAILDANQDGWPDIVISNDTQPNKLYINNRNGTFTEKGVAAGIAYSEDGVARAGMGIDAADYDRSGYPSLLITNFSNQMVALYHNERNGLFVDEAPHSDIGRASLLTLGFGCFFFDYDLDGWPDIYIADGHIEDAIERVQQRVHFAEPPHLFHNLGGRKFETSPHRWAAHSTPPASPAAQPTATSTTTAPSTSSSPPTAVPPSLFLNTGATNHSLRIKLIGTKSNRDGIGAIVPP